MTLLIRSSNDDDLIELSKKYINPNKNIGNNTFKIRHFVGGDYERIRQQDAAEFFLHLCEKSDILQNNSELTTTKTIKCNTCNIVSTIQTKSSNILFLSICNPKKVTTLQELIYSQYFKWNQIEDCFCNNCNSNKIEFTEIIHVSDIIVLQIALFLHNNTKKIKGIIKSVPTSKVRINGIQYEVTSAILHDGETILSGHYRCLIKNKKTWVHINDSTINTLPWPKNSDNVYVMILSKI